MKHLSPDEILALVESANCAGHEHLWTCAPCRAEVEEVRRALDAARTSEMPEPSPLFWDHLSARISERLGEEPEAPRRWRFGWRVWVPSMVGVMAVVLAAWIDRDLSRRAAAPVEAPSLSASLDAVVGTVGDDESWSMLGQMAGQLDVDSLSDTLGTSEASGAERALDQLSAGERASLADLLQAQMRQGAVRE